MKHCVICNTKLHKVNSLYRFNIDCFNTGLKRCSHEIDDDLHGVDDSNWRETGKAYTRSTALQYEVNTKLSLILSGHVEFWDFIYKAN